MAESWRKLHDGGGDYWPGLTAERPDVHVGGGGVGGQRAEESATCEDRMCWQTP